MKKKPSSPGRKSGTANSYKKNASERGSGTPARQYGKRNDERGGSGEERGEKRDGGYKGKRPYSGRDNFSGSDDRARRPYSGRSTGGDSLERPARPRKTGDDKAKRPYADRTDKDFKSNDRPRRFEDDKPKRPYNDRAGKDFNKSDRPRRFDDDKAKRQYKDKPGKDFNKSDRPRRFEDDKPKRSYSDRAGKDFKNSDRPRRFDDDKSKRSYGDKPGKDFGKNPRGAGREGEDKPKPSFSDTLDKAFINPDRQKRLEEQRPKGPVVNRKIKDLEGDKPRRDKDEFERKVSGPFRKKYRADEDKFDREERFYKEKKTASFDEEVKEMTLNKYIAHSSTSSRREAAEMVKQGKVKVNGELMLDPGYRVQPFDKVTIAGKKLTPQKGRGYILLNKPKGYLTTTDDPEGRKTVMELVQGTEYEKLYPVGRLDRNTTGLLLLTNDGDLAQKLSHPSFETKKVYQVSLNKPLAKADFEKIMAGLELEDGPVKVDDLAYLDDKSEIGIEIHSGRNRIVRRIFESLGYEVEKLDRVMYAGLTKKNLPRGKWRMLTDKEIILLKHFKV